MFDQDVRLRPSASELSWNSLIVVSGSGDRSRDACLSPYRYADQNYRDDRPYQKPQQGDITYEHLSMPQSPWYVIETKMVVLLVFSADAASMAVPHA